MSTDQSFDMVMSRLKAGDAEAASQIFGRFVDRLVALASRQFEEKFWAKADPEEVVQSVYQTFFRRQDASPFALSDWDGLWALLAKITLNKCHREQDYWRAGKRDARRENPTGDLPDAEAWQDVIDQEPTPYQAMILAETLERLLIQFDSSQRQIVELTLQGYTTAEIAVICERSERTVARVIERVRERIREIEAADSKE